jgi:hypothetical protein
LNKIKIVEKISRAHHLNNYRLKDEFIKFVPNIIKNLDNLDL